MCMPTTQHFHHNIYSKKFLPGPQGGCSFKTVTYYEENVNREIPTNK